MFHIDHFCNCHLFLAKWLPYFYECNNTCWDWHFLVLDGIMRYLSHITLGCSFSNLTLWKLSSLVLSLVASFFVKLPTWVEVCFDSNICSFKCHANTFPLMSWGMHLVINSSYHTYISFILKPFPYNIMYPSWLVIFHDVNVVIPLMT
jgi:hypothetical protein